MTDTETWARDLLTTAADTIPTGPPPDLRTRPSRRTWWSALATAAAVIIAVGVAFALPGPELHTMPAPVNPHRSLTAAELPLVFGMTAEQATRAVSQSGFVVATREEPTCDEVPGRVMSLTSREPGRAVLTVAAQIATADCSTNLPARRIAWQLIDLATGRGPGPDRAPDCCAAAVLRDLEQAATHFVPVDGIFNIPPVLVVRHVNQGFEMVIGAEMNGKVTALARATVEVLEGRVTDVRRGRFSVDPAPPDAGERQGADPDGAGRRFLEFATGSADTLPLDTPVRLYLGNTYVKTISRGEAETRSSWNVCAPYDGISCPMSALFVLDNYSGQLTWTDHPSQTDFCPDTLEPGPPDDTGGSYAVVLSPAETGSCLQSFEVQVWVNDVGQIVAVNLLLGTP